MKEQRNGLKVGGIAMDTADRLPPPKNPAKRSENTTKKQKAG